MMLRIYGIFYIRRFPKGYDNNLANRLESISGSTNSLGQDYYRIFINNEAEVPGILQKLQSNGFYVIANTTTDGGKFLAISEKNIFGK